MYPELFHIGGFPVNTYGVLLALAFMAALFVASRLGGRDGLPRERVFDLGLWMLLGGLVGSKLLLMVAEPEYGTNWRNLISIDFLRSGGVWYGGFIGGLLTGVLLIRRYRLSFWKVTDAFAPGVAIGQAVGRQGCFAAGCCWGRPTDAPWGVEFGEAAHRITGVPVGIHLHPTQLYESAAAFIIFLFLYWLHRRKRFSGQVIATYAVLYGLTRFTIEFFRDDPRGDIAGLTTLTGLSTSQLISLVVVVVGIVFLVLRRRRSNSEGNEAQASDAARA
ncbi:MAG: phosphatidylglycerol---prolipoprotein diacylglyceryl transferase [Acidobacteriota bacterium]|jgi:phosphatidylglycerol:prolipoprotein diacylglycerol transferase|nr:phosphatidylglycerol---prolipoprotein diacylglyceryl transferase [Acidobacteriota bacterium]MDT7809086.1 phosphatidylglycerol---prolipoprotein diacylglyceryl transferase [Acidobacteriota bacterium]